ncbi:putative F-box protein At3g52320 [Aegilops tauschii subsp. strangulata]|uniref:putative F-box protein At3g52320 n=1 Tax=Aegilops tauschii subsp. strangulata TaxID=200361 RepID=UPI003CC888B6
MAAAAGAAPLLGELPDAIVLWEILVRLDPKSILRCRAVRRGWRSATSTRGFLLAHHARQPALSIFSHCKYIGSDRKQDILLLDHQAAQLHTVVRFDHPYQLEGCCDGLLLLSTRHSILNASRAGLSVCNPTTREMASPGLLLDFNILGMYPHRPTGEYRLLLQGRKHETTQWDTPSDRTGFYVLALGSHQPPRHVGCGSETKLVSAIFESGVPVRLRDCLHWYRVFYRNLSEEDTRSKLVVFDTIAESFRQMRAPLVPTKSCIFEMDDTLGIYTCNSMTTGQVVDIWVLHNYESEAWDLKYRVRLPIAQIRGRPEGPAGGWFLDVASGDGNALLLVCFGRSMFYIDTDGKLVATLRSCHSWDQRLKQTLVPHDFFAALEGYAVNGSPFIPSI